MSSQTVDIQSSLVKFIEKYDLDGFRTFVTTNAGTNLPPTLPNLIVNNDKDTLLHRCALLNSHEILQYLLETGLNR